MTLLDVLNKTEILTPVKVVEIDSSEAPDHYSFRTIYDGNGVDLDNLMQDNAPYFKVVNIVIGNDTTIYVEVM